MVLGSVSRDNDPCGPLHGLCVVEIGQYIAAPYASLVLADLGARVVKVEPPTGDGIRTWGPHIAGESAPYMAYNRNKESIVADLETAEGAALVERLLGVADVLVENNRPGVMERFQLDATRVRARYPSLIYCSITGYGAASPYGQRPGFDLVIQGVTGLMSLTGNEDDPLAKVPVPIVDGTAALHAATAIVAAVHRRSLTGEGATIDISLQASTLTWLMLVASGFFSNGELPSRIGSAHPFAAPYQAFETADLPMTIAAGNDRQWSHLCEACDLPGLLEDPRFVTNAQRALHQRELAQILTGRLRSQPRAHWIDVLSAAGVPCGPVNSLTEALDDRAVRDRGMLRSFDHPRAGPFTTIGNPIEWAGYKSPLRRPPLHGEHTRRLESELAARSAVAGNGSLDERMRKPMPNEESLVVHRRDAQGRPQMAETRLERLLPRKTATQDLFVVHHYEPPPTDAAELGRVLLTPRAGEPVSIPVEDLQRLGTRQVEAVLECAGNGRRHLRVKAPGTQFDRGLVGAATWEGVPLAAVLDEYGFGRDFQTLVAWGLDRGWAAPENQFAQFGKGLPPAKALHPDTLLAWAVNDEPLPFLHGGPLRLVVPGWAGVWWVKWVTELAGSDVAFEGFWQKERYRYVGGAFDSPEVVYDQLPRALILEPQDGAIVDLGVLEVRGRAWSGGGAVSRVEVTVDGGATWDDASFEPPSSSWGWVEWTAVASLPPTPVVRVSARATDAAGTTQQWDSTENVLGYGNNGIMSITVHTRGWVPASPGSSEAPAGATPPRRHPVASV
jgi:formyl-CoA transferase